MDIRTSKIRKCIPEVSRTFKIRKSIQEVSRTFKIRKSIQEVKNKQNPQKINKNTINMSCIHPILRVELG